MDARIDTKVVVDKLENQEKGEIPLEKQTKQVDGEQWSSKSSFN